MITACVLPANNTDIVILRHGQSLANLKGIIASQFSTAGHAYGLTDIGRDQVAESALKIKAQFPGRQIVIVASPLLRTQQTAQVTADILGVDPKDIITDKRFIERDFSYYEGQSDQYYKSVWAFDEKGLPVSKAFNRHIEELRSVHDRTREALDEYAHRFPGAVIIVATHGDVASNIITSDHGKPLSQHRAIGGLPTAGFALLNPRWALLSVRK